jgi:hypothetical protein
MQEWLPEGPKNDERSDTVFIPGNIVESIYTAFLCSVGGSEAFAEAFAKSQNVGISNNVFHVQTPEEEFVIKAIKATRTLLGDLEKSCFAENKGNITISIQYYVIVY